MRSRTIGVIVTLGTTLALTGGSVTAAPTVAITSPSEGATVSASAPQVELSGTVAFDDPAPSSRRFYLRRSACGGTAPQGLRLSLVPGSDGGSGCSYDGGWNLVGTADEAGRALTFPAADGLPFSLDGSRPLTAKVVIDSYRGDVSNNPVAVAAGLANLKLSVSALSQQGPVTLGTETVTKQILPNGGLQTYDFSVALAAAADKKDFSTMTLTLSMTGPGVGHGNLLLSGASYMDLPVFSASPNRRVEISLDGAPFSAEAVTLAEDLTAWSATIPTPAEGDHTLRARLIQGFTTPFPVARTIRVT